MLTRLLAKGVGPFENLDMDFSDGNGNPHLGPHIIAGVNGSGKSTALRSIGWCFARGKDVDFPAGIWKHLLRNERSAAQVFVKPASTVQSSFAAGMSVGPNKPILPKFLVPPDWRDSRGWRKVSSPGPEMERWLFGRSLFEKGEHRLCVGAYSPNLNLEYVEEERLAEKSTARFFVKRSLGFKTSVRNEVVQRWWLDLFAREALSADPSLKESLRRTRIRLEEAIRDMMDPSFRILTDTQHGLALMVELHGQLLNLSQIPDGVRTVLGWLADFFRRRECVQWDPALAQTRPSILLIDEIDTHLHPRWQRRILRAIKKALPDVQIIVTTHSPFVITSCPGARVHVLELDRFGNATARPPRDAPIGSSITATLRDIFDVDSRFDVETEDQLKRWNQLKRNEAAGTSTDLERAELQTLTATLAGKNSELRAIVKSPPSLPEGFVKALLQDEPWSD